MIAIAVDDEVLMLGALVKAISASPDISEVVKFSNCDEALEFAKNKSIDVAFLDINMRGMGGLALAEKIISFRPDCKIVFCTGYEEYAVPAFKLHASGYLMKPVTAEDIEAELQDLRYPIFEKKNYLLYFRCFGAFEVFNQNGDVVCFERKKAKELLAYLLYKQGKNCTNKELHEILFEEKTYESDMENRMYQTLVSSLNSTLKAIGAESVLQRSYGTIKLDVTKVACDWYEYLVNKENGNPNYRGEFMRQYSWAEVENGNLSKELYYGNE